MRVLRATPHPAPQKAAPMKPFRFIGAAFVQHLDWRAHYRSGRRCAHSTKFDCLPTKLPLSSATLRKGLVYHDEGHVYYGVGQRSLCSMLSRGAHAAPHRSHFATTVRDALHEIDRPCTKKEPTQRPVVVASVRWAKMDSNHRRRKPADLQSAPFGHSGICPFCVCDGKGRHKSRKHQGFPRFYILFSTKKPISPQKRGKNRFANVFYYSKDWTNCTILTAVMANSRPLFIFSPARSSACCSSLTVSTPLITGTLPVALSRTSPSVVPRQM